MRRRKSQWEKSMVHRWRGGKISLEFYGFLWSSPNQTKKNVEFIIHLLSPERNITHHGKFPNNIPTPRRYGIHKQRYHRSVLVLHEREKKRWQRSSFRAARRRNDAVFYDLWFRLLTLFSCHLHFHYHFHHFHLPSSVYRRRKLCILCWYQPASFVE